MPDGCYAGGDSASKAAYEFSGDTKVCNVVCDLQLTQLSLQETDSDAAELLQWARNNEYTWYKAGDRKKRHWLVKHGRTLVGRCPIDERKLVWKEARVLANPGPALNPNAVRIDGHDSHCVLLSRMLWQEGLHAVGPHDSPGL